MTAFSARCLALALATTSSLFAGAAAAQVYVRADAGASWSRDTDGDFNDDLGVSPAFQLGVGYQLPWNLRTDFTVAYRPSFELDSSQSFGTTTTGAKADITSVTAMLNLYYDIDVGSGLKPYVGGGVGYAYNEVDDVTYRVGGTSVAREQGDSKGDFAWALMAGLGYSFTPNLTLDLGYRYLDAGEYETSGNSSVGAVSKGTGEIRSHEIMVGLRYRF